MRVPWSGVSVVVVGLIAGLLAPASTLAADSFLGVSVGQGLWTVWVSRRGGPRGRRVGARER